MIHELKTLRIAVRDSLIAEHGEAYHELSWYVSYVFGSKRPWRVTLGPCDHRTTWSGATSLAALARFKTRLTEWEFNSQENQ